MPARQHLAQGTVLCDDMLRYMGTEVRTGSDGGCSLHLKLVRFGLVPLLEVTHETARDAR